MKGSSVKSVENNFVIKTFRRMFGDFCHRQNLSDKITDKIYQDFQRSSFQ